MLLRRQEFDGITLTESRHPAGEHLPWHWHDGATICCVLEGGFTERVPGVVMSCTPSSVKIMPAGERHCNEFNAGTVHGLMVEVSGRRMEAWGSASRPLQERRHIQGGPAPQLGRRICHELSLGDAASKIAIEGLLLELVALGLRSEPGGQRPGWLVRAAEMLRDEFRSIESLAAVARACGVHPVTLSRGFKQHYGVTAGEYLRRARLDHAATLLVESSLPLTQVALAAGFADQAHFSNVFRRYYATSPGRYRKQALQ